MCLRQGNRIKTFVHKIFCIGLGGKKHILSNLWWCILCPEWPEGGERRGEVWLEMEPSRLASLLQCQTVTDQSAVGAVSTAAMYYQFSLNKDWYLVIYSLVVKEWRCLSEKLIYVWNSQIFLQTVVR